MVLIIVVSGELGSYTHCRLVVRFPIFFLLLFSNLALHCGQRIMYFQSPRNFFLGIHVLPEFGRMFELSMQLSMLLRL